MLHVVFVLCNYMAEMGLELTAGRPTSQKASHRLVMAQEDARSQTTRFTKCLSLLHHGKAKAFTLDCS